MHPIERLRYVARASGGDQALLVRETAYALGAFHDDPAGLVAAARRVVVRHPTSAPLWWLCAHVLTAPDPGAAAHEAVSAIDADRTGMELVDALPDDATVCIVGWPELVGDSLPRRGDLEVLVVDAFGEASGLARRLAMAGIEAVEVPTAGLGAAVTAADVVLVEADAVCAEGALAVAGSLAAASVARHLTRPVWLAAGVGRAIPTPMWEAMVQHCTDLRSAPWDLDEEVVPMALVDHIGGPTGVAPVSAWGGRADCAVAHELIATGRAPGTYWEG